MTKFKWMVVFTKCCRLQERLLDGCTSPGLQEIDLHGTRDYSGQDFLWVQWLHMTFSRENLMQYSMA